MPKVARLRRSREPMFAVRVAIRSALFWSQHQPAGSAGRPGGILFSARPLT
jgi:hypothetical protein